MADTYDLSPGLAQPFKDTRAEGYVTYYTKVGWDHWNLAAKDIAELAAQKKITYEAAYKLYLQQMKDLEADKDKIQKKIDDIQKKKVDIAERRKELKIRLEAAQAEKAAAAETAKRQKMAVEPAHGGRSGGGGSYAGGGKDPYDELMDEIVSSARPKVDDKLQVLSAGINESNMADRFSQLETAYANGSLPADALTRDMTTYTLYKNAVDSLVASGKSQTDAEIAVVGMIQAKPALAANVTSAIGRITAKEADQAARGGGSSFVGARQNNYEIANASLNLKGLDDELAGYDKLESSAAAELAAKNGVKIAAPVLEPIDMITAARKEYIKKYGDIPRGVTLNLGNETVTTYKDLMPFEVTNAMDDVTKIFGKYITNEITSAKTAADAAGKTLTADEINAATELGKQKARAALFGSVYTPSEASNVAAGKSPNPQPYTQEGISNAGWSSVGVTKPSTGDAASDEAAYQKKKEEWAAANLGTTPQTREAVAAGAKERIGAWNKEIIDEQKSNIEAVKNLYRKGLPEGMDVGGLKAPPTSEPGVNMEDFFRSRVAPTTTPDIFTYPTGSLRGGEIAPPSLGEKPEGNLFPEQPTTKRSVLDIILRGFKPELDRRTGQLIIPPMSGPDRAEAIAGVTKGGLNQYENFPESMRPPYPREVGGESFRPLSQGEFPRTTPLLNKLDRAALGIPDSVGTPAGSEVLGGDMGAFQRKKEQLQEQLDSLKSRREFMKKAGEIGTTPSPMDKALEEEKKKKLQEELDSFKSRKEFMQKAGEIGRQPATIDEKDIKAKSEAVLTGTAKAQDNPVGAAKDIGKDSMGKYISALYDANVTKGVKAEPIGSLTQTVISEYAGDAEKQKKAVQLLTQLAYLDQTKSKINA